MSKYVIVDLEMCNVPKGIKRDAYNWRNELIQIGAVVVDEALNITDEFMTLVSPEFGVIDNFIGSGCASSDATAPAAKSSVPRLPARGKPGR